MHTNCVKSLPHLRERLLHSGGVARTFAFVTMSLVQNGPDFCRSVFYKVNRVPEHLAEHLHRLGDGAGAFAGAAFTKYIFRVGEPPYILVLSGGCHSGAKR